MEEKRRYLKRRSERAEANVVLHFSDGERLYTDHLVDISMGGIQIETMRPLEPATALTLSLPCEPPVKVRGRVRWARKQGLKYRVGIEFLNLTIEQEYRVREITRAFFWNMSQTGLD